MSASDPPTPAVRLRAAGMPRGAVALSTTRITNRTIDTQGAIT
jgi:hypothetical protein